MNIVFDIDGVLADNRHRFKLIERPDTDTMTVMEGTYKDAEEMARSLLKENPDAKIIYGRLDVLAKVEAPPVKFTKL